LNVLQSDFLANLHCLNFCYNLQKLLLLLFISNNSAISFPALSFVNAPIGWVGCKIKCFIQNKIWDWLSITGNELGCMRCCKTTFGSNLKSVCPRSSKPGSPSETLLSNQPCDTCKL
jgi:hypothetical protein